MAYTFSTQKDELASQLGLDKSQSSQATLLERWLNNAQHIILDAEQWPFNRASTPLIVQTVTDITTGTATVTAGNTTVTLSSGPSDSVSGRYIQFASSDDWYEITAHTAGSTSLTISPAAISANSAATYTIRKFYYSTDSTVDRILSIKQSITPFKLVEMSQSEFTLFDPNPDATGTPKLYAIAGTDSSDILQFMLWPTPDEVINLFVDYYKKAVDLSADSDESVIPEKYVRSVMMEGALWQGYKFIGDTRETEAKNNFFASIEKMKENIRVSHTQHRVRQRVDQQIRPRFLPFPSEYPDV